MKQFYPTPLKPQTHQLITLLVLLTILLLTNTSCQYNDDDELFIEETYIAKSEPISPRILINGIPVEYEDATPQISNGHALFPVAETLTKFGYSCRFNRWMNFLVCRKRGKKIVILPNRDYFFYNDIKVDLNVPTSVVNGEILVERKFFNYLFELLVEFDEDTQSIQLYDFDKLDYGLYFFDIQDNPSETDDIGSQKFVPGQENPFFDPSKPTVIWVHGWQSGGVKEKHRNKFHLDKEDFDRYIHNEWKRQGWNVAIYNWVQLADEALPGHAESKINSATQSGIKMRWKKSDGKFETRNTPSESISELFAQEYERLVGVQTNPTIRLAGSSFGAQVVLHGTEIIKNKGITPLPKRMALLDMAWTPNFIASEGMYSNKISARAAQVISEDVLIEFYRTSPIPTIFTPWELVEASAFQEMKFSYAGNLGIELKHTIITEHYFWSLEYAAPPCYIGENLSTSVGLSASTDDETLRAMMGKQYHWIHREGRDTFDPGDDTFDRMDGRN